MPDASTTDGTLRIVQDHTTPEQRLDVAYRRIDELTQQLTAVTEERDAYGDTLAGIRDADPDDDINQVAAKVIAHMVLERRGYVPFGRTRRAEAAWAQAEEELGRLRPVAQEYEKTRAHIARLRSDLDATKRRINGALHLLRDADPAASAGHTAVLLANLRTTLTAVKAEEVATNG
jgi:hypothetical protein